MPAFYVPNIADAGDQTRAAFANMVAFFPGVPVPKWYSEVSGRGHTNIVRDDTAQDEYEARILDHLGLPDDTEITHDTKDFEGYISWVPFCAAGTVGAPGLAAGGDDDDDDESLSTDPEDLATGDRIARIAAITDESTARILQNAFRNGPVQAGVGAVGDLPDYKGLKPADHTPVAIYAWLNQIKRCRSLDKGMLRQCFAMAAILSHMDCFHFPGDSMTARISDEDCKVVEAMDIPSFDQIDVSHAISCVVACKISFWQTNHHVGSSGLTKVVQKILAAQADHYKWGSKIESGSSALDIINPLWLMVHLFDTKSILAIAGCKGIKADPNAVKVHSRVFVAAKDLALRARACPSGTAKVYDCAAVIDLMSKSVISTAVTFTKEMTDILRYRIRIQQDPAAYHVGAHFLTGEKMRDSIEPSAELITMCKTFLNSTAKFSSLNEATVFKDVPVDSVFAKTIAKAITTYTTAYADAEFITADTIRESSKVSESIKDDEIAALVAEYKAMSAN